MIGTIALAMLYPLPKAIAIMAIPSLMMNVMVLFGSARHGIKSEAIYYAKKYGLLVLTSLLGSIAGVKLLLIVPAGFVYLLMAAATLYFVVSGYLSQKGVIKAWAVPTGTLSLITFGLLAGVIGGATNAMSPILMMYLFAKTQDKTEIVKASNLCYLVSKVVQIILLKSQLLAFSTQEITTVVVITLAAMVFLMLGIRFRSKVSPTKFKNAIFIVLLLLALKVGYSGLSYFN